MSPVARIRLMKGMGLGATLLAATSLLLIWGPGWLLAARILSTLGWILVGLSFLSIPQQAAEKAGRRPTPSLRAQMTAQLVFGVVFALLLGAYWVYSMPTGLLEAFQDPVFRGTISAGAVLLFGLAHLRTAHRLPLV